MQSEYEEICGSFTVETGNYELKQVLVIQKVLSHYSKDESYSKSFRLESLDGITVYRTNDPDIFTSASGIIFKKKNR
jgi:hypothetical protein